jgi:ATP-binding cassette subfamily B protein
MKQLARYLKYYKKEVIVGPIFKLTEAVFELIVPLVMASMIDLGIAAGDKNYVLGRGGIIILLGFTGLLCALICQYLASRASQGVGTLLRRDLFAHIAKLSHEQIDKFGTPSLVTRLTSDINQIQLVVAMLIRLVVRAPFLVLGSAIMALSIDWQLGVIFLVAAPLVALALYMIMSRTIPFYGSIQRKLDKLSLITRENLGGSRVVRAFSRQNYERERFDESAAQLQRAAVRAGRISALLNPLTFIIINLSIASIVWFGGFRVNSGAVTQGQIYALVNYMTQNLLALIVVSNLVVIFTKGAACAARINEMFALEPSITDNGNEPVAVDERAPVVELRGVSFTYPGAGAPALRDVTIAIRRGETIGVIGGTGSGKSTLINLIPRFYDVSEGELFFGGTDVRKFPLRQLRGNIAIAPQQAVLFSDTLRNNLLWGSEGASDEQLWAALRTAQAERFVSRMPDGLDAMILQGGKNLSGGQRQRLTIARALVAKPELLILDDSFSALDTATDAALRSALKRDTAGMSVIIVSQRIGTVKTADRIVVLDDGVVAGIGTHDELMDTCPEYREIFTSQLPQQEAAL